VSICAHALAIGQGRRTNDRPIEPALLDIVFLNFVIGKHAPEKNQDGMLAQKWAPDEAVELMWTLLSIHNWEHLTMECGWSTSRYVGRMQKLLKRTFVKGYEET